MTETTIDKLIQAASNPVIVLSNHPLADADAIAELAPVGYVAPEDGDGKWWFVTPQGYDFAQMCGADVCRWYPVVAVW